jgi:acyl dehydratase
MDDVTFYKPVEIGDILSLEATVTYTSRRDFSRNTYYGIGAVQSDMVKTVVENSNTPKQTFVHVRISYSSSYSLAFLEN